jgi:hypothetical protein
VISPLFTIPRVTAPLFIIVPANNKSERVELTREPRFGNAATGTPERLNAAHPQRRFSGKPRELRRESG